MAATLVTLHADLVATRLRDLGLVSPTQLEAVKQEVASTQERVSVILVRQKLLRDPEAGRRLAAQLGAFPQRPEAARGDMPGAARVPDALWRAHRLAPLEERDGALLVATDDPLSVFALEFLGSRCGCRIDAVLVTDAVLTACWQAAGAAAPQATSTPPAAAVRAADAGSAPAAAKPALPVAPRPAATRPPPGAGQAPAQAAGAGTPVPGASDEPIVRLVDSMLAEAVRLRASDVHVQPSADALRVRYRIDGVLHDVNSPPRALHGPVVSRLKILAGLNIAERRLPQDGRLQTTVEERAMDIRLSTLPALHGESVVMRLLDRGQPVRGLVELGMLPDDQTRWETLIRRPYGMLLVTGPTGSGKTTTLYGALATLNQPDRKLITVEDPVEYQLPGVNQVAVRSMVGLTFAAGLRSMLRQAPDVIMVGEIRDAETAQVAVQAALTGHLVLSTLHTNDAASSITRLIDMGVPPFLVASTVQGVLAQRLVRRVCPSCRITDNATPEERVFLGGPEVLQVIRNTGCDKCRTTGFLGRLGVFELLVISDRLRELIVQRAPASLLRAQALKEGMRTLRADGIGKIREGLTTMAEVLRVITETD